MLLPEQKRILEELIAYLRDKPVGSVEFIAFSDFIETFEIMEKSAKESRFLSDYQSYLEKNIEDAKKMLKSRNPSLVDASERAEYEEQTKNLQDIAEGKGKSNDSLRQMIAFYENRMKPYPIVYELVQHEINRSMSMIPGYYQAHDTIQDFYTDFIESVNDTERYKAKEDALGYFSSIQEAIYDGEFETYSLDEEDEDENEDEEDEETQTQ